MRQQRDIFGRVEIDGLKRAFEIGEAPLGGNVRAAEPLATPLGDRMQRRVLQQLRGTPFGPSVWRIDQPRVELLDQARLAEAGLADDLDELALARPRALPAPQQHRDLLLAADQWRQRALARAPAAAAGAHDPIENR